MVRVAVVGASGYTGAELARILVNHPQVRLTAVTSRKSSGQPFHRVYPHLFQIQDLLCEDLKPAELVERAEMIFTAVPHQTAMEVVPELVEAGCRVIDLSADFRIHDAKAYEAWYQPHTAPELLPQAVYGLPELHRQEIASARLVANPGCYPTSAILALAPLLSKKLVDPGTIIIDSKSGTSGAGRSAQVGTLFCEVTDGFKAYKVAEHRHTPEIEQELSLLASRPVTVSFTPHLVPMSRGILTTVYARAVCELDQEGLQQLFEEHYRNETFVRVLPQGMLPATQYVRGSNYCDLAVRFDRRTKRVIVLSAIDNLVKGAAGQAVQNMNLMQGFAEDEGLRIVPLFP